MQGCELAAIGSHTVATRCERAVGPIRCWVLLPGAEIYLLSQHRDGFLCEEAAHAAPIGARAIIRAPGADRGKRGPPGMTRAVRAMES